MRSVVVIAVLLAASAALAQQPVATTGGIRGTVRDRMTRAPLPDVGLQFESPSLNGVQAVVSDDLGAYMLHGLPPGSYKITVTVGHRTFTRETLIYVGKLVELDIKVDLDPELKIHSPVIDIGGKTGITIDDTYTRNIPVRRFAAVEVVKTTPLPVPAPPRTREGRLGIAARSAVGVRRIAGDLERAPLGVDLEAAYSISRRTELVLEARYGIERDTGVRAFRVSPGARVFLGDHLFVQSSVSLDVVHEFGLRTAQGLWLDLTGTLAVQAVVAQRIEVSDRFVLSLDAGLGVQARFR